MGSARPRPQHLARKLLEIRERLGISQRQMVKRLGLEGEITYTTISKYENDVNEPPLGVLLAYARIAEVCMDVLANDKLDLLNRKPHRRRI